MTYEFEGRTEKEAIELAASQLGLQRDQFDVEILESQKNSLFKKGYVKICVHTIEDENTNKVNQSKKIYANPLPESEFEEKLLDFINNLITKMGYEIKTEVIFREERKIGPCRAFCTRTRGMDGLFCLPSYFRKRHFHCTRDDACKYWNRDTCHDHW